MIDENTITISLSRCIKLSMYHYTPTALAAYFRKLAAISTSTTEYCERDIVEEISGWGKGDSQLGGQEGERPGINSVTVSNIQNWNVTHPIIHFPVNVSPILYQIPNYTVEMDFFSRRKGGRFVTVTPGEKWIENLVLNLSLPDRKMNRGFHDIP